MLPLPAMSDETPTKPGDVAVVGLTGGIGSGKSTVARALAQRGFAVLDADVLARAILQPGQPTLAAIAALWPEVVVRGVLDRPALGKIVFSDSTARKRLEDLTHPRIHNLMWETVRQRRKEGHRVVIYEASLLVESGQLDAYAGLIVVTVPPEVQLQRALQRGQQSEADIRARIAAQLPLQDKLKHATHVIDNSGSLEQTLKQVEVLAEQLRKTYPHADTGARY